MIAENRLGDAAIEGVVLSAREVSERRALENALRHQALRDALTGLANRALFEDRLADSLAGARRHGSAVAVLFLDLDDFRMINDSLGHASGDELLRAVSVGLARSSGSLGLDELLRNADTAVYAAKCRIEAFQAGMHQPIPDRLELIGERQQGLERDEFELDYHRSSSCIARWAHRRHRSAGALGPIPRAGASPAGSSSTSPRTPA